MPLEIKYSIEEMENQFKEISCKIKQKDKEMGFPVLLTPPTPVIQITFNTKNRKSSR